MQNIFSFLLLLLFYFYFNLGYGQENLVLNPSFEEVNPEALLCRGYVLPAEFTAAVAYWTYPTGGSTDIFHLSLPQTCLLHPLSTHRDKFGDKLPRTGNSMSSLLSTVGHEESGREYLQGQLSSPLIRNYKYKIQFYVTLTHLSQLATNNFGIKFYSQPLAMYNYTSEITDIPDANHTSIITNNEDWVLIELEFTPLVSDLQYFVLGNFFSNEATLVEDLGFQPNSKYISRYYVDDVAIFHDKTPSFDSIGPFCQGATFTLPEISKNGYKGTWAPEINNQETTTYTFTPEHSYIESTEMTVEITPPHITPTFMLQSTICQGTELTLPTLSTNGYRGTWSPNFNNQHTTTYTFTPEEGYCVLPITTTIEITNIIHPKFHLPKFVCKGVVLDLPEISDNGILGEWFPSFNPNRTTTYTFTPVAKQECIQTFSTRIEVKQPENYILDYYCHNNQLSIEILDSNQSIQSVVEWKINGQHIEANQTQLNLSKYAQFLLPTTNTIEVYFINQYGCTVEERIDLTNLHTSCFIPKGISPQSDQYNERFDLQHLGKVDLQIWNRFGAKVYENKNYSNQWQGQSNSGRILPAGTYFYQITTYKNERLTGWVQVVY